MAKILHTADLHLQKYGDEQWQTLEELIEIGKKKEIDLLIVSGDFFDQGIDAENLRNSIRRVFADTGFKVAIIPGNHDIDSFAGGRYFGENVVVLEGEEKTVECGDVVVWGLPYEQLREVEILWRLHSFSERLDPGRCNILLYHGELLDAFFNRTDLGEEGEHRYMPVKLSYFQGLGFKYVLAGHFHSAFKVWEVGDGGFFVYPGSPVSITKRETGQRAVNLFEPGNPPCELFLDSFHFEEVVIELDPFSDEDPLQVIEDRLQNIHPEARVILRVKGFMDGASLGMNETDMKQTIENLISSKKVVSFDPEFRDISYVLEDRLTKNFLDKLEEKVRKGEIEEEMKHRIFTLTLRAMMEAK